MDSATVNSEIRREIRPLLKDAGFTCFIGRNSWRYAGSRIDVINFQSFNSHNASLMGCTTYSFSVNLGCYLTDVPDRYDGAHLRHVSGELRPTESECPFRGRLRRGLPQPECEPKDVWYIDPDGRYLRKALHDVRMVIARDGLAWFERLAEPREVLRILSKEDERMGELWGFGRNPSPIRHYLLGYAARNVGEPRTAAEHLSAALASGCFAQVAERIQRDIATCGLTRC